MPVDSEMKKLTDYIDYKNSPPVKRRDEDRKDELKRREYPKLTCSPEDEIEKMKCFGNLWLKYYNEGKFLICENFENMYEEAIINVKKMGADTSKYPDKLEELLN